MGQTVFGAPGVSWVQWSNPSWTLAPGTQIRCCMFYNISKSNKSVLILDFGTIQLPLPTGVFTIAFPTTAGPLVEAVLRLA